jgi:thiosulfate/3-mercaptopyruvate sulfurtransferase
MSDPVVSTEWLAARLGDADLRVVDATWFMPAEGRSGRQEYVQAHIPGAVFFDIDEIADKSLDLPHMLPTPEAFALAAGELGLSPDARIVIYDAHGIFSAPRVWWMLRTMGFPHVHVLDGGLKAWTVEGRQTESGDASAAPVAFTPAFDAAMVRDAAAILAIVESGSAQIVDARPGPRFRGETPEPRAGLRSGHMPGARNLAWNAVISSDGRLRPSAELETAFRDAEVDLSRPIVTTCGSGVTAAVLALALARLGHDRIPIYDGSWTEWGGRPDTPITTGP